MEFLKCSLLEEETRTCGVKALHFIGSLAKWVGLGRVALALMYVDLWRGVSPKPEIRIVNTVFHVVRKASVNGHGDNGKNNKSGDKLHDSQSECVILFESF